ncbi:MAG: GH25 family lysozyme [Proteobacteria bacterium]|nr:GH25 family lysozyme [Pseudomonadota bacterium]
MTSLLVSSLALPSLGCVGEVPDDATAGANLADDAAGDVEGGDSNLRARVCATHETTKGIDVSKWQGDVNWSKVKTSGVAFAFLRVSDGATARDAKFDRNWAGTKANGIIRGAYQFFRPSQNVTAQADLMIAALGGTYTPGDLPPVIDVEDDGGLSTATVAARTRVWVDRVGAALGVTPIVYTGKYFWRDEVGSPASFGGNPLWIAQYTSLCPDLPAPWAKWTFWQYTDKGSISGVSGNVDTNRFNGTLAELQALAMGTPTAQPDPIDFGWIRNTNGSYDFAIDAPSATARVELRVDGYLIGAVPMTSGHGALHYTFNVATADRAIEARGLDASGAVVSLGNGIIDSQAGAATFARQTGTHEYEIGWERPGVAWRTLEVSADGTLLTDLDSSVTRSTRGAVRYQFSQLGDRSLTITIRNASGAVVSTVTRTLTVR